MAATPCDGAKVGYWKNPDGNRGGSVASTAKVSAGVIIGPEAQVCGEAVVSGKTHIFGRAKITGKTKIHNAKICQASQISGFDVVDSDYYCQTEDPEPPHPGEAGKKTLLGIDSDNDGVRDDVEIWINDKLSNQPSKDLRLARLELKEAARSQQTQTRLSNNKTKVMEAGTRASSAFACLRSLVGSDTTTEIINEIEALHMDTAERTNEYNQANAHFSGMTFKAKRGIKWCSKK